MQEQGELIHWIATVGSTTERGKQARNLTISKQFLSAIRRRTKTEAKLGLLTPQLAFGVSKKEGITIPGLREPGHVPSSFSGPGWNHA